MNNKDQVIAKLNQEVAALNQEVDALKKVVQQCYSVLMNGKPPQNIYEKLAREACYQILKPNE